ncbi:MAG: type VI secretion system Vgr family protein [candidate division Zixibacteria bacterium]|nr:type VI secretion system Vgr family protein [candidate division Zixibacteria bacterium]
MPEENDGLIAQVEDTETGTAAEDRPTISTIATTDVVIDGRKIEYDISRVELRQYIHKHHVLRVEIRERAEDTTRDLTDYSAYLGKSISLNITPSGGTVQAGDKLNFVGLVTRIDQSDSIDAIKVTTVIAHSPTVSMDGAGQNKFFKEMSASDIISQVLGEYQITRGTVDASGSRSEFTVQYRESDYDFVMRLAAGYGKYAFYDGDKFHVTTPTASSAVTLTWRETLGSFSIRLGTAPREFAAQTYNYVQNKTFEQDSSSLSDQAALSGVSKASADASKKIFKKSGYSASAKVVADARALDDVLKRDRSRAMGQMVSCVGESDVPALKVGHCIKVRGLDKVDGDYLIHELTHLITPTGGYRNSFTGRPLDISFPPGYSKLPTGTQMQSARVVDNQDPDQLGRVKVKFPWLDSDDTVWLRVMTPHAGKDRGFYFLPEVDDEVLVGFEFGSPHYPIVLGSLFNKDSAPSGDVQNSSNDIKAITTKGGSTIQITDTGGSEEILIATSGGDKITLSAGGPTVTLETSGDVIIKSGANLNLEAGGQMSIKASGSLEIQGATVAVKGSKIDLN